MRFGALIGRLRRGWVLGLGAILAALLLVASSTAATLPAHVRVGPPAPHPAQARVLGPLSSATPIQINVTLKPSDPAGLAAYAAAVSTPGSSVYHHYLTVAQFRRRFGPSGAQIAAVDASLRAHGLYPGRVSANGLAIPVSASAARIGSAFSLSFQRVALPSGRTAFANTQPPQFDTSVAGDVQGVVGLDSISVPSAQAIKGWRGARLPQATVPPTSTGARTVPSPCPGAAGAAGSTGPYTADQLAGAYQLSTMYGAGDQGGGQTIALFELEPNSTADIAAYQSCYGTHASVSYVQVDGGAPASAPSQQDPYPGLEATLDIEDVIGLAPQANVVVYQGPNSDSGVYDTYARIVSDDSAQVISTSWGLCETYEGSDAAHAEATLFQEAAAQGQTVFAAAGDSGSEDCGTSALAVDDPASQPYVTGVGGTTLSRPGPPPTESVWNNGGGAGGGGISSLWTMPSYQTGVVNGSSSGSQCGAGASGYCRQVPDVSADADPNTGYVVYWDSGWGAIGGTSAAAPLWAAYMALVNASSACQGIPVGFANPALYAAAASHYASDFSDVTLGNNDNTGRGGQFAAGIGYDMASGLGTPIGPSLAADLCGYAGSGGTRLGVTNPGPQRTALGSPANLQIGALDSGSGVTLTYAATGLPAGLSIDGASGAVSGTPTAAGSYPVKVTVTDTNGASEVAQFTWSVTVRSTSTSVSCSPGTIVAGAATTCTATASDADTGTSTAPAGTIWFGSSGSGSFSGSGACTLAPVSATSASCSVSYRATGSGAPQISASYTGDTAHGASAGSTALTVSPAPAPAASGSTAPAPAPAPTPTPSASASRAGGSSTATTPRCPAPSGRAGATTLGLVKLGMTRSQARHAYANSRDRASRAEDVFCLTPAGMTVGYASSSRLLGLVARSVRRSLTGRVVWIATGNPAFALDGIRVGTKLSVAAHRLKLGKALTVGAAHWYVATAGGATVALKVRGGVVQEIGLAARQLTRSRGAQRTLLSSF